MYVKINVVRVEKTSKNRNHQQNQKNIINLSNNQILIRIYKNKSCYVRGKCGHHPTNCQYRRRDKSLKVQKGLPSLQGSVTTVGSSSSGTIERFASINLEINLIYQFSD